MTPTQTRDAEATQAQILEAAAKIFAEKGLRGSSVSEIAAAAGVTKSLIHHHFGSKDGLWNAIKERHFREYFDVQMGMLSAPGTQGLLERSIEAYFRFLAKEHRFVRMMCWMQLEEVEGEGFALGQVLTREGIRKIRESQEAGEIRDDVHPFSILVSFLGLAEHWFQGKELHCQGLEADDEMKDDDRYLDDMMKIFFEGIVPRSAPA